MNRIFSAACVVVLASTLAPPSAAHAKKQSGSQAPARVEIILDDLAAKLIAAADAHWHKGEYNHNVNISRMILAARPDIVETYANTGWLLWSMNRDAEAVALYEKGLKANPESSFMYDELGQYYLTRKKDYPTSVRYYEQAVRFKDVNPRTWNALARAYEKTGQMDKAVTAWEKAATFPENVAAQPNLKRVRAIIKQRGGQ